MDGENKSKVDDVEVLERGRDSENKSKVDDVEVLEREG